MKNSASNAFPFFVAGDISLEPVIDDVEADLGPAAISALRLTGGYYHVVGYLAEYKLAGVHGPIYLGDGEADVLASIIREWERSDEGQTRGALRPGQQWGPGATAEDRAQYTAA